MRRNVRPGLDQCERQTQREALEPELAAAPAEALPELARLVDGLLGNRGYEDGTDRNSTASSRSRATSSSAWRRPTSIPATSARLSSPIGACTSS
jgi:hypothetical protein